jgi:hypothetical protein
MALACAVLTDLSNVRIALSDDDDAGDFPAASTRSMVSRADLQDLGLDDRV